MKFGFFKKDGDGNKKKKDLFDPTEDALDFDELEESGEFLNDESYNRTADPGVTAPPPRVQPSVQPSVPPSVQPPMQPPVRPEAQSRPASPLPPAPGKTPASKLPPAPSVRHTGPASPPAPPVYDDLTVINDPNLMAQRPAAAPPATPPAHTPPAAPLATPSPPVAPTPPANPAPPRLGDDDVTMVLNTPVGAESVVAWLVVASNPGRGQDFRLPRGMARIGSEVGCEIHLQADSYLSSRHAEVTFCNGQYYLRDLDSTNGSFVNDGPITEVALQDNDRIRLAQTTFIFKSLNL